MKRQVGLTLVELVVAITLASLLMAALLGVLGAANKQLGYVKTKSSIADKGARNLLYRDLLCAASIAYRDGRLELHGEFMCTGDGTSDVLSFSCTPWVAGKHALIRKTSRFTELVEIGPSRLIVERVDDRGASHPISTDPAPVPAVLRCWLSDTTGKTRDFQLTLR